MRCPSAQILLATQAIDDDACRSSWPSSSSPASSTGLDDPRAGAPARHASTPSTCRSARRSRSRWSGARTSATRSPSTRRCSTAPGSSARPSPAWSIGAFGVGAWPSSSTRPASWRSSSACALMDDARAARRRPGSPGRNRSRAVVRNLREGLRYVRVTPVVLLAVVVGRPRRDGRHELQRAHPGVSPRTILDSGAAGYGFLMAASGVGSLLAALWLVVRRAPAIRPDRLRRDHPRRRRGRAGGDRRPSRSRCC